jgi:hypothetical protein
MKVNSIRYKRPAGNADHTQNVARKGNQRVTDRKYDSCFDESGGTPTRRPILGSVTYGKHEPTDPIEPILHTKVATCRRHTGGIKHSPDWVARLFRGPQGRAQFARTRPPRLRVAGLSHDRPAAQLFGRKRHQPAQPLNWKREQEDLQHQIQNIQRAAPAPVDQAVDMMRLTSQACKLFLQQPANEQRRMLQTLIKNAASREGALRTTLFEPFDGLRHSNSESRRKEKEKGKSMTDIEIWLPTLDTFRTHFSNFNNFQTVNEFPCATTPSGLGVLHV